MKKLYIKQKVFSIADRFAVTDEAGNRCYQVTGSFLRIPKRFKVVDAQQTEVAVITKKLVALLATFNVEVEGQKICQLRKSFTLFKSRYTIKARGLTIKGDWWNLNFSIMKNGRQIAKVKQKLVSFGDTYEVKIEDEQFEHLVIAIVIAIDCVKADQSRTKSHTTTD